MSLIDSAVGAAIDVATDKALGDEKQTKQEKHGVGYHILRFVVSVIWFLIAFGAFVLGCAGMVAGEMLRILGSNNGIVLCIAMVAILFLFAIITMCVPFLRKKGSFTRFCGLMCIPDALWWIYLIITFNA